MLISFNALNEKVKGQWFPWRVKYNANLSILLHLEYTGLHWQG
jgi:hypothetical protein